MANTNTLTYAIPTITAQGLMALRQNCIMPRLVNSDYGTDAKKKGSTIDIPIPSAITAGAVSPSYVAPDTTGISPTEVNLTLDQWYSADFFLSDKDIKNAIDGIVPMQASEAIKAIANKVDNTLLALYKDVYNYAGTPGVTPFGTNTKEASDARKKLNQNNAAMTDRRFVMNPETEANALNLRAFQDASFSGDARAINEGQIVRKLGMDFHLDQNMPTHLNGAQNGAYVVNGVNAQGSTSLIVKTGTGDMHEGDLFTIAGDSTTYVVAATYTGGAGTVTISPGLSAATSGDEAITFVGSASTTYNMDLAFHRDAFVFASRPLTDSEGLGNMISAMTDPVSGLSLRMEVSRQHKRTLFSFDMLWGVATVRPELACRVYGDDV